MTSTDETASAPASTVLPGHRFAGRYAGDLRPGDLDRDVLSELQVPGAIDAAHSPATQSLDPEFIRRFGRELKLARRISHVVRMYELLEDHGTRFIVMEYVPGEDLRSLIRHAGRLSVSRALAIARQVCEGLAAAHRLGVVHRDLKPANVMIDGEGSARIMDFGLARSFAGGESTVRGVVLGTPGYMAPEQAAGLESDPRTDIYALGVILFAMLTGEKPLGPAWHSLLARARGEAPGEAAIGPDVIPEPLLAVVATCLESDPARRFQSVEELQGRLAIIAEPETPGEPAPAASSAPPDPGPARAPGNSIAVLPFTDLSPERDQEYFCDGIADELISSLTAIKDLRIAARGSSFSFKGTAADIREIGRRLGVATILDGSVRKAGNRLRITAELVSVADGFQLWSERYDPDLADIFAIQDDVAAAIIEHLKLSLLPQEERAVFKRATEDVEAHSHYLRGLHYLWAYSSTGFHEAIACFERAVARDPSYALAYWGLADAHLQMAFWGTTPPSAACGKVTLYARKAVELDPALGDAHGALSYVYTIHDWNWPAAEREARDAVRLSPKSAMARAYYSWLLINTERFGEGLAEASAALRLDPDNSFIAFAGGLGFIFAGQFQRAIDTLEAGIAHNPGFYILHWLAGETYAFNGRYEEALAALVKAVELSGRSPYTVGSLGVAYQRCGHRDRADAILQELTRRAEREHVPQSSFFLMHMARGDLVTALRWLEKAGGAHDSYLSWIRVWPWQGVRARGEATLIARAKKALVHFLVGGIIRRHRILEG